TRHQQGGESSGAVDDGATGLGLAELSAQQCAEPVVHPPVCRGEFAAAEDRDRGRGAEAVGGALEGSRNRRPAGGSRGRRLGPEVPFRECASGAAGVVSSSGWGRAETGGPWWSEPFREGAPRGDFAAIVAATGGSLPPPGPR